MAKTILLADDSVTIQKVVELTFMDEADYEVKAVSDGSEAMRQFAARAPALVIADVHMPGLSGYEVCRQVKQASPGTPVLLLVGTFEPFDEAKAVEVRADGHLKKPFDSQDLLNRVAALVRNHQAPPPPPSAATPVVAAEPSPFDEMSSPFELEESYPEPVAAASDPFPTFEPAGVADVFELEPEETVSDVETQKQVAFNLSGFDAAPVETELFEPMIELAAPVPAAPRPAAPQPATLEPMVWPHELAAEPEAPPIAEAPPKTELPRLSIPVPASAPPAAPPVAPVSPSNGQAALSDADVDRIARRVADLVAEKIVREVAWEVIPDLAEIAIRERIQELESEIE